VVDEVGNEAECNERLKREAEPRPRDILSGAEAKQLCLILFLSSSQPSRCSACRNGLRLYR